MKFKAQLVPGCAMDRLGRIPPVALLLLLFMGDSLQTPVNAEELSVTSDWLVSVASHEQRGFDSLAGQICDGTLGQCNNDDEEFMMAANGFLVFVPFCYCLWKQSYLCAMAANIG